MLPIQPLYLEGKILKIHTIENSERFSITLEINKAIPSMFVGESMISGLANKGEFEVGDRVRVFDQLVLNNSFNIVANWNTKIFEIG